MSKDDEVDDTPDPGSGSALHDEAGNPLRFETALKELESLVDRMEGGELSLEDSVGCFERGMQLHQFCQQALEAAEQKVQVLLRRSERVRDGDLGPFAPDENDKDADRVN